MISLGIDVGTTRTKVLAVDIERGTTLGLAAASTPTVRDVDGEAHRPADILDTVAVLLEQVVGGLETPDRVRAICVASVGEEVVLVDRERRPVGDTIVWHDPRGTSQAATFMQGPGGMLRLSQRWPPDATFSLFKLMWMQEHRGEAYAAASSWTDLGDYVLARLGGDLVMDWSHASRAGAFDVETRTWDGDSIDAAGVEISFPRLVPSGTAIGTVERDLARHIGLPDDVVLVAGGHDHLCAAFGAGVRTTSELFLSAGTSEAHLALIDGPAVRQNGRYRIDQGCYVDGSSYYAHINIHSGHFFRQWRGLLYPEIEDDEMYAEIESAPPDGITFDLSDHLRLGRLDGVPYSADRAGLMRAILVGLADRSADIVDQLERAGGRPYDLILVAGHPVRIPFWKSIRMAAYGRPMASVDEPESTAFGAAVLAATAVSIADLSHLVARRTSWSA